MADAEGRKNAYSGEAVRRWEENLSRPGVGARAALAKLFDRTESYIEFGDQPQRSNAAREPAAEYLAGITGEALEIARAWDRLSAICKDHVRRQIELLRTSSATGQDLRRRAAQHDVEITGGGTRARRRSGKRSKNVR
jgi:hypothetical protein